MRLYPEVRFLRRVILIFLMGLISGKVAILDKNLRYGRIILELLGSASCQ